jgi:hypothetical protein
MSEPNSASDPTPEVPKAPSFTYGQAPAAAAPASTPLPPPTSGERMPDYAAAPAYGSPGYGAPVPLVKPRRTWDMVLTIILLVVGFFGMLSGIGMAALMGDPSFADQYNDMLGQQGIGGDIDFGSFPAVVAISHIVLYLLALGISIPLLITNKIAFYVPLSAGVIAAIVFWGGYFAVVFSAIDLTQVSR